MGADDPRRRLPQVQRLLEHEAAAALCSTFGRPAVTQALRDVLGRLRAAPVAEVPDIDLLLAEASELLAARPGRTLTRTINATGIVLHTNLGRAPLAAEAMAAAAEAGGYANLEYDLARGVRGTRTGGVEALLCALTGAEAALAVNNGAAAILLALAALAGGGEVIVSRGELVEIGGGFRIPDVIRQGGAALVEVGATNRTRAADYRDAVGPQTRVLLKVHQSNFRTIGFTEETGIDGLAEVARANGLLVVADVGSGAMRAAPGLREPTLRAALDAGADLVTCSGDKLLGGPQAGLILGRAAAVDKLRRHPLLRAVRLDKLSIAALEATLALHRDAPDRIPVLRMLGQDAAALRARAERLRALIRMGEVVATDGFAGGGALPEQRIASWALALSPSGGPGEAAAALRQQRPTVVGRIADGRLLLDMLTVADAELPDLAAALAAALARLP